MGQVVQSEGRRGNRAGSPVRRYESCGAGVQLGDAWGREASQEGIDVIGPGVQSGDMRVVEQEVQPVKNTWCREYSQEGA